MKYKYVIARYSKPVLVADKKEDAVEIAKAAYGCDDEDAEEYVYEVLYIPQSEHTVEG